MLDVNIIAVCLQTSFETSEPCPNGSDNKTESTTSVKNNTGLEKVLVTMALPILVYICILIFRAFCSDDQAALVPT